jgi:hypothetical protein
MATKDYIPFTNRNKYVIYKFINYGKSYSNYTTYKLIENTENIDTIYIDNEPFYVEIHYTKLSNKKKLETIMINKDIDTLITKYGNKV